MGGRVDVLGFTKHCVCPVCVRSYCGSLLRGSAPAELHRVVIVLPVIPITVPPSWQYKRVPEYLSRFGIRECSGGYPITPRRFWVPARTLENPIARKVPKYPFVLPARAVPPPLPCQVDTALTQKADVSTMQR